MFSCLIPLCILSQTHSPLNIIIFGDSLSSGYNLPYKKDWVSLLASNNKQFIITNASVSGATSTDGLHIATFHLNKKYYHLVIIALGGNDFLKGIPIEHTRNNLEKIIKIANRNKSKVLILGIPFFSNYGNNYRNDILDMYKTLSVKFNSHLNPNFLGEVINDRKFLQSDGIHFNQEAQAIIQSNVEKSIKSLRFYN